jgi:CheY-like chemotaxis protein
MAMSSGTAVQDTDVFGLTDKGSAELTGGWTQLPAVALELMVVLDGKTSIAQAAGHPMLRSAQPLESLRLTAQMLLQGGFIVPTAESEINIDFSYFFNDTPAAADALGADVSEQVRAEVEQGTAALKSAGYYVSIARKAAAPIAPANQSTYCVMVVEDNPDIQGNLRRLLKLEGFLTRHAGNRDEILKALRVTPLPDVMLLDVNLPDANGFDVLARLRQHPQLKKLPVIMLTAMSTREDVLHGLAGGADGYITKPFDRDALLAGIKAVLGLHASASVTVKRVYGAPKT